MRLEQVRQLADDLMTRMNSVIEGKPQVVSTAVIVLLAEGHLLVEDVPGVGKTMLAKTLARSIDCQVSRVQFTPDLLPSDITGVSVFNQDTRDFEFRRGAIFANVIVGDEINRASPKTQSALLEAMEERQVTVDGQTYPLPEAQRDRFMARISMGYPSARAEMAMLESHGGVSPLDALTPVTTAEAVQRQIEAIRNLHVAPALRQYVVELVTASRTHRMLRLGASPRAGLQLMRAGRAHAALAGRDHVLPEDVQAMAVPVLAHRVLQTGEASLARASTADIIRDLVERTTVPSGR